ncbi:anti-sigma factor [Leucobacter luti]|uniref:Regulator of SigK n=1 Tax=Leucobacter luti TaxID=340320 RepID=A0A4V6MDN2_9MICO|nr:anti-sigma factor [Leucobacter luti]MBL3700507.1 anti-sigma factor [Leucobacter luti]RZT68659.1 anti-sigma-K factor RskA [Leucobacter luti]
MNEHDFRELSAARALHALSPDEEQEFSRALAAHPEWQSVVDEDRATAAAMSAVAPEIAPPDAARSAILDLIARTPQFEAPPAAAPAAPAPAPGPVPPEPVAPRPVIPELADLDQDDPDDSPPRHRKRAVWFTLAASVAVMLVVSLSFPWGTLFPPQDPASRALELIAAAPDANTVTAQLPGGATGTLLWSADTRQAVLVTEGMEAAPEGRDYELWIVRGSQPVSLGVMRVGDGGDTALLAPGFVPGDAVAVTVEEQGGSPTGLPTTEPLFVLASA